MQSFLYLVSVLVLVAADGYYYETPATRIPPRWNTLASAQQYQYHTQDGFGQYSYGYGEPLSTKQEVRTQDGITRGSYTYLDADGKLQTVTYTADADGFHVAGTNLPKQRLAADGSTPFEDPQSIQDTPEVATARLQHLAAHQQAKMRLYGITAPISANLMSDKLNDDQNVKRIDRPDLLPQQVEDTPEVAAAKAEFFKRYEEVKQRNKRLRQKQQNAGYALVKSQPLTVTLPLKGYRLTNIPRGAFRYDVIVPSNGRKYLPEAKLSSYRK
ncbi:uncharacterized protein LOC105211570 [Zeugodacus cucurbitae]|uniref:uncharacterized protein LOC105211570 n=1 Tax=Zeugodacus cucurbitae TaxID=28588 RepID=UPI0023D8FDA1|nr:uncharacterized protein LOC105211570 [Zeugodacus cucurbitae]